MPKVQIIKDLGTHMVYGKLSAGTMVEVSDDFYNTNKNSLELVNKPKKKKEEKIPQGGKI